MKILSRFTRKVILEVEGDTLSGAYLEGANLRGAYLTRANLEGVNFRAAYIAEANLTGANLTRANLSGANLLGADLTRANLTISNLTRANLLGANLTGANLTRACLRNTIGNGKEVKSLHVFQEYQVNYTADMLWIGCCKAPLNEVFDYSDDKIKSFDDTYGLIFWKQNKEYIQNTIQRYPATPTGHEKCNLENL